ncbi:MAG: cobalt ECF transporter T component CbiQ [Desulfoarculaceae bacterium]|nr:cobalt ECF transporter T component CbiQ [Desulfoarculaceae bacterium]
MIEEPFAVGTSLLHRRDARVKIMAACALTLVVALTGSFLVATIGLTGATLLLFGARLQAGLVLRHLLAVNLFTLFLWLTLPLTYGGDAMTTIGGMAISHDGIRLSALITLKTNAVVFTLLALLSTSSVASLGHGLEGLSVPPKLCFMLLSTYRYIFVIHQEYQRLLRAARMRGFVARTNLHTYKTFSHLLGMTLVKSWNRARRVHQAMILRGFTGQLTPLRQSPLAGADYLFLLALLTFCGGLAALNLL